MASTNPSLASLRYTSKASPVFIVGAQPPPTHGMSIVNSVMTDRIRARVGKVVVIDLSPGSLDRDGASRLRRLPKVASALWHFLRSSRDSLPLYISISGGLGQIYEVLFVVAARLSRMRCFLHHHSYAYLNHSSLLTKTLLAIAGHNALHICLSQGMADQLKRIYSLASNTIVVSNSAMLPWDGSRARIRESLRTIGFLGNISSEKGIFDFIEVASSLNSRGHHVLGKIAGPFQDKQTEQRVLGLLKNLSSIEYVGPKYGQAKELFLRELDVLLFPTRYLNEAEPLTIHEAMMHGVPVIASNRGAISEILSPESGLVVDATQDFVHIAVERIEMWLRMPDKLTEASTAAAERFANRRRRSLEDCNALLDEICGDART